VHVDSAVATSQCRCPRAARHWHSVEVTADTLYEAAATALSIFKRSESADVIGPNTELLVTVKNSETMHRVTPDQIQRWCDGVAVSPDEVLKRRR